MARAERLQVALAPTEREWLAWYAAEMGRTPSAAAARLLSERIGELTRDVELVERYRRDRAATSVPNAVVADIQAAFAVPGVAAVLGGDLRAADGRSRQAAGYLNAISAWLAERAAGEPCPPAPRLAETPPIASVAPSIGEAMQVYVNDPRSRMGRTPPAGTPVVSDKGQLSDTAMGLSQENGRQAPEGSRTRA